MHIQKKQLLGFGGLALVAGITAVAYNLPTSATSVGGNVDVVVQVYGTNFETKIEKPLDGDKYTESVVTFREMHSKAENVKYYLTHYGEDGAPNTTYELTDYEVIAPEHELVDGVTQFDLDLNSYGGWGRYKFTSVITSSEGRVAEDYTNFSFVSINIVEDEVEVQDGKIRFTTDYAATVKIIDYEIYDNDGKVVATIPGYVTKKPETGGSDIIVINVEDFGLKTGNYIVKAIAYDTTDRSGGIVGTDTVKFYYTAPDAPNVPDTPDAPNVPDTGALLSALNISKSDFLITGVLGFTIISIIALFVIRRANKRK